MKVGNQIYRGGVLFLATAGALLPVAALAQSGNGAVLFRSSEYLVRQDRVIEGPYSAVAISSDEIESNYPTHSGQAAGAKWMLHADLSAYPQLHSDSVLIDAIYKMSLEELTEDISSHGTFDAGALWPGPWTRDVSYSTLLSLAIVDPLQAETTLLRKVKRGRIVQDTGTGGSWPVSSDRECWAIAAWEIYAVTGNRAWLEKSAVIIKNSMADDEQVVIDHATGLAHGETSFMDWREQTYPRWMQPADIYTSEALSTNAVFYRVFRILAAMDRELGCNTRDDNPQAWDRKADRIRSSVNALFWRSKAGLYGEYRYGRIWQSLSPRTDALGEALSILFDLASPTQQQDILKQQPLMPYGVPTVYPETPGIPPYHNRSIWPFVQSFYNLAAAKNADLPLLAYGLGSIYRSSALFLTNKENFVADTGSPIGTVVNSDRQLWSVAGNLAMVYRVFFGMAFTPVGVVVSPVIPESFGGTYQLSNFRYRNAVLTITVHGFGDGVLKSRMDGTIFHGAIPTNIAGRHRIDIEMNGHGVESPVSNSITETMHEETAPQTPVPTVQGGQLTWPGTQGAVQYGVYRDATEMLLTAKHALPTSGIPAEVELQVDAIGTSGFRSFLSEPVHSGHSALVFPVSDAGDEHKKPRFVMIDRAGVTGLSIPVDVPSEGTYSISFRYANGNGPINTGSECAVRTLFIDGIKIGPIVLPQRGAGAWNNWGESTREIVHLKAGKHNVSLRLLAADRNMSETANAAEIASVELIPDAN